MGGQKSEPQVTSTDQKQQSSGTMTPTLPKYGNQYAQQTAALGRRSAQQWANDAIDPTQIAGFNPDQEAGFSAVRDFAQGSPYMTALGVTQGTAAGDYLYGGPAQQAFIDASVRQAMPGVMSAWGSANRSGGQLGKLQLSQQATDAYAGLYDAERNRQMAAAGQLPELQKLPIDLQMSIGQLQQSNQQDIFNAQKQAQDQERARDSAIAQYAAGAIPWTSVTGQKTTGTQNVQGSTSTPMYTNPVAGALGGLVGGAQLGQYFGGPIGAAGGAAVGGILGYYG